MALKNLACPEPTPKFNHINDAVHGLIELTNFEKYILGTAGFNRLHDVYQNSTVYLTFPSNRTKRFEHSLGTMKLASDMFLGAVKNTDDKTLDEFIRVYTEALNDVCLTELKKNPELRNDILRKDYQSIDALPKINFELPLQLLVPPNVKQNQYSCFLVVFESVRIAALLHDIGHPPYSHIVESSLQSVYNNYDHKKYRQEFQSKLRDYVEGDSQLHEKMGYEIAMSILRDVIPNKHDTRTSVKDDEKQFRLIVRECVNCIFSDVYPFNLLHNLIDGTLDADRLDYTVRDPMASGMNIGSIDYNRIFTNMRIVINKTIPPEMGTNNATEQQKVSWCTAKNPLYDSDTEGFWFGNKESEIKEKYREADLPFQRDDYIKFALPVKALNTVEDYLSRRFDLYKTIILHHHVVKTDYLLKKAVELIIEDYLDIHRGQLNGINNYIASDISGLWFPLGNEITVDQREDALSQWNDSWLMTCLKQYYYRKMTPEQYDDLDYIINRGEALSDIEKEKYLEELLELEERRNARNKQLEPILEELICNRKRFNSLIKRVDDFDVVDSAARAVLSELFDNKKFIGSLSEKGEILMARMQYRWKSDEHGFFLGFLERHFDDLLKELEKESTFKSFQSIVLESKPAILKDNILDSFVIFKTIKTGIGSPVYFYTEETFCDEKHSCKKLTDISKIEQLLDLENDSCPTFFIYVSKDYNIEVPIYDLLKQFGENIGNNIANVITDLFE